MAPPPSRLQPIRLIDVKLHLFIINFINIVYFIIIIVYFIIIFVYYILLLYFFLKVIVH